MVCQICPGRIFLQQAGTTLYSIKLVPNLCLGCTPFEEYQADERLWIEEYPRQRLQASVLSRRNGNRHDLRLLQVRSGRAGEKVGCPSSLSLSRRAMLGQMPEPSMRQRLIRDTLKRQD